MHFVHLLLGVGCEIFAVSFLKASEELSRSWPSVFVLVGYVAAFYFLTLSLRVLPIGISYALWSGLGIVAAGIIGLIVYKQRLDLPALVGMGMIIGGTLVIHIFSGSLEH